MMLQGLVNYYDRLESTGEVAPSGYAPRPISFALVINEDGQLTDVIDIRHQDRAKPRPTNIIVPIVDRTSGVAANFLWDKTAYALGISKSSKRVPREHSEFKEFHGRLLAKTEDCKLKTFLKFIRSWNPASFATLRYSDEMIDKNIVFRVGSERSFIHEQDAGKKIWAEYLASSDAPRAACLITGEEAPIRRIHSYIENIARRGQPRPKLIAIDKDNDAFASFGKEQGENAPVSEQAAHKYATALNVLLARVDGTDIKTKRPKWTNRVEIGNATTVFWAQAIGGLECARTAEKAESLFATLLEPPTDEQETTRLRILLQKVGHGRPLTEADPGVDPATSFYVLGLSPNAARLSIRFFLRSTLGELVTRAAEHYRDLSIEPRGWITPPAAWRLLLETAVQRKDDNISPALAGELARAILTGARYPRSLLSQIVIRVRADGEINGLRAAMAKAYIARAHRKDGEQSRADPEEDIPVALDRNEANPGYRLGRLFYVLENAQRLGVGRVNATIRDKFYASASANPARVFPLLLRGAQDHIGAVRRKSGGGLSFWLDEQIAEIVAGLPASKPFPSTLRLEDQGRFLVGYYHQRNAAKSEGKDAEDLSEASEE